MPSMILAAGLCVSRLLAQTDGSKQWAFNVQGFIVSSPAISADGSTIYVGVERRDGGGRILAITPDGQRIKWDRSGRDISGPIDATPTIGPDGTVYVGGGNGRFYALDPNTGASKWELPLAALSFIDSSAALAADGTLYFGSGDSAALTGALHAVSSTTGKELWTFPSTGTIGIVESSPAIAADGTIYFGSHDKNLYAVTPAGTEKWHFPTGGRIFSSPAIGADGTIYIGSGDQKFYALTPQGAKKWEYLTRGDIQSSPVLGADGTIYFGGVDTTFYALRPEDGSERWKTSLPATMAAPAAVRADGFIIVAADDDKVRALDPRDGTIRWTFDPGIVEYIDSAPLVAPDGAIYVGSLDGNLYKLNGSGSPLSVVSSWPGFHHDVARTGRAGASRTGGLLANIATRARVSGSGTLIAGFVVQGLPDQGKAYLVRAIGPGLAAAGVGGFLPDPRLELFSGRASLETNDNWQPNDALFGFSVADTAAAVGAFALDPGSRDAAIVPAVPPGVFTAHVTSADGRAGVALVEIYDARRDLPARISNLSTRGAVGTGEDILIAGFVVGGTAPMRLLLRGIGPGLAQFGVGGVLARPRLELFRGTTSLRANTGWTTDGFRSDLTAAAASVSAFPLAETSADSALIFDAIPGPYTVQISGVGQTTGEAMVEIYVLP